MRPCSFGLNLCAVVAAATMASGRPADAADIDVDLELVLAVDISRSMDYDELRLQREGYVTAIKHPEVVRAILSGLTGRIALTYLEWAGPAHQSVVVPWSVIASEADAATFADRVAAAPIMRERGTSISGSLLFSASQFDGNGARGIRRAIDVSGDGPNNMGLPIAPMRDRLVAAGITINGLPITLKTGVAISPYSIPNLDVYYEDCVIGGPGAFMITVNDTAGFGDAVRRKLVLEIAGLPPRLMPAAVYKPPPRIDCLIGEKLRGRWFLNTR